MSESDTDTYTVSFKTGPGYDASLLVVRGNTPGELVQNISAIQDDVVELVVDTENLIHAAWSIKNPLPTPQTSSTGSQTASQPDDGGEVRLCAHGKRNRRQGEKNGKTWVGWFCALPKGSQGACKAEFEDNK